MATCGWLLVLAGACLIAHAAAQAATPAAATPAAATPAAATPAADPCAMSVNFFPPNYENANTPSGWTSQVQSQSGNTRSDQLLTILLGGYPIPTLNLLPDSVYTRVGSQMPASCAVASANGGTALLTDPADFTITWALAGQGATLGPYTRGDRQDPPANISLGFVPNLPDGNYCLDIKIDLAVGSGRATVGAQEVRVPSTPQSVTRKVCFIKLASRPTANVTFHSCNSSLAVVFSGIKPPPIFVGTTQMTSTVFHVYGKLRSTFTTDQVPASGAVDYFDEYVTWADPAEPAVLTMVIPEPNVIEGFYNVSIEGSLSTMLPSLVNLYGQDVFPDGTAKFMGFALRNASNRPVPVQIKASDIEQLEGPMTPVAPGAEMSFTWNTVGYGETYCYVDKQPVANAADRKRCVSPLVLSVTDTKNHTLEVELRDVCGDRIIDGVIFGSFGWVQDPKYAPPPPPPSALLPVAAPMLSTNLSRPALALAPVTSGAGAALPAGLASAGALLLGALAAVML